jgi:nicotinate phosphoribosyltransferase
MGARVLPDSARPPAVRVSPERLDRSVQTDARAEPARPEDGTASGASSTETEVRRRLPPEIFDLPVEKMLQGYYTDAYFNHARDTLLADGRRPRVLMQVFQRNHAYLGGMDEAIAILKLCSWDGFEGLTVHALYDGDKAEPWETVMTIEGDYTNFAHLETL